jgi:hypothetical protein
MFPAILFAQPKITDIVWKGQNKEYLQILKKTAGLKKGQYIQEFKVVRYAKNEYIILSSQHTTGYLEQKYNIVRFTKDTLILAPEGKDIFKLSQLNEENQYVFVNTPKELPFGKLHFASSIIAPSLDYHVSITLYIDSARNSRVKIHDDYMNETNVVTTKISKKDYKRLIQILAACDMGSFPEEFAPKDQKFATFEENPLSSSRGVVFHVKQEFLECSNSIFQVQYNDQIKKCKGCTFVPFYYPALEDFLMRYIAMKSFQSGKNPKLWY